MDPELLYLEDCDLLSEERDSLLLVDRDPLLLVDRDPLFLGDQDLLPLSDIFCDLLLGDSWLNDLLLLFGGKLQSSCVILLAGDLLVGEGDCIRRGGDDLSSTFLSFLLISLERLIRKIFNIEMA